MEWIWLITFIILFFIEFILEFLFYTSSKKEKAEDGYILKTHAPKRRFITSLSLTLLLTIGLIICIIYAIINDKGDLGFWIALSLGGLFIIAIPFILFLIAINDYEIIQKDGIFVHRMFHKRFIKYEEMKNYQDNDNALLVYDKDNNIILIVADMRVGITSIIAELEKHKIQKK